MRNFWFPITDTVSPLLLLLLLTITTMSYAESDGKWLHENVGKTDESSEADEDKNITVVGDMLLTEDQLNYLYSTDSKQRLALANPFSRWPNGEVFYHFDQTMDQKGRNVVKQAMDYIESVSCVRFTPKTLFTLNYVLIKKGNACNSKVGFRRGAQHMIIDGNLCTKGSVIHELLHCLGFLHMHTAPNRDEYISVNWENVRDDAKLNFKPYTAYASMFETEYDYDSITHYSHNAFAKNKSIPTIIAKNPAPNMGQRKKMSEGDITRINRLYNCAHYEERSLKLNGEAEPSESMAQIKETNAATTISKAHDDEDAKMEISESNLNSTQQEDEDDMILRKEQIDALYSLNAAKRNGLKSAFHHWPMGIVAFEIDPTFRSEFISSIYDAMNYISNRSCVRFKPRTAYNQNYIYITRGPGCSSEVGMRHTGRQLMNINEQLCPRGKIIHELLHALGFLHMHTANERDNYIKVNWENIKETAKFNFKQFVSHVSMFSTQYDYNSIMHYSPMAFAKDRSKPTLVPLHSAPFMGQREGMSAGDVIRLNRMYKCGPEYDIGQSSATTIKTPTISSRQTIIGTDTTKADGDFSRNKISDDKKRTMEDKAIFGMLIFKTLN